MIKEFKKFLPESVIRGIRYLRSPTIRSSYRALRRIRASHGMVVASGPFSGLRYINESVGSELAPKLIGTYEMELHSIIMQAISFSYDLIVDIGAAEGYYAVGLATKARIPVVAFESCNRGQRLVRQMAELNAVGNLVKIKGLCTPFELKAELKSNCHPLVLSDCEGAELEILDLEKVPGLVRADVLVEVHGRAEIPRGDYADHPTAMAAHLRNRFMHTHDVKVISKLRRLSSDWPSILDVVPPRDRLPAMHESRASGSCWLWMVAKSKP